MIIFIITQIATMGISIKIKYDTYRSIYKHMGDSGYKIDPNILNDIIKNKKPNKIRDMVNITLFVIPGINIISSVINRLIDTKKFGEELINNKALSSMTDLEMKAYQKLNTTNKKITFVLCCDEINKEYDKIMTYFEDSNILLQKNIAQLYYEKLPQIAYTLDEVKMLSKTIQSDYKIGKIDGVNSAIIGLPQNSTIEEVILKKEKSLNRYQFEKMDEEETRNGKFIVYPFDFDFEGNEELKKCYKEIIDIRDNNRKNMYIRSINVNKDIQKDVKTYVKKRVK